MSVLGAAVHAFMQSNRIQSIVISVPEHGEADALRALDPSGSMLPQLVTGGSTRQESVFRALSSLSDDPPSYVLIHDGARPWVDSALIGRVLDATMQYNAAIPVIPLSDSPKELDDSGFILQHLTRSRIMLAQTPQGFRFPDILHAHEMAVRDNKNTYTDDAEVWGDYIGPVATVPGSAQNRKITVPEDINLYSVVS
ncbi:2-C-methyl-D-erythritol 4-phosphate cytidylyltransferase [Spirochaetia bacterium]|nr:2-C-methyl-D-erythritol 4-phosphate cytidylyltransferase [Spirochaetia bacterium]